MTEIGVTAVEVPVTDIKSAESEVAESGPTTVAPTPPSEPQPSFAAESSDAAAPKEEAPEPQNALTKRFTEAEWAALKEFRKKLPEIFTNAYGPENPDYKPSPITMWGVPIDPTNPALDARTSVVLMKFLRARELKVDDAAIMLTGTLRWRLQMDIDAIMKEEFDPKIFGGEAGRIFGKDRAGRPVVYNVYGGETDTDALFRDVRTFVRWRVQLQEKSNLLLDFESVDQTTQVHDYEGVSMMSRTPNQKAAASEATNIFQNHYPELLAKKYFINVPTIMSWVFWAVKSIVSAATFAKLSMVGTSPHAIVKALTEVIDIKEIPKKYGGEAEGF